MSSQRFYSSHEQLILEWMGKYQFWNWYCSHDGEKQVEFQNRVQGYDFSEFF